MYNNGRFVKANKEKYGSITSNQSEDPIAFQSSPYSNPVYMGEGEDDERSHNNNVPTIYIDGASPILPTNNNNNHDDDNDPTNDQQRQQASSEMVSIL